jgi:phage gpG-like protein
VGGEIRVDGADDWAAAGAAMMARVENATDHAVDDALYLIQGAAQRNLTFHTHPRGTPTPSAPGEPPALISGALRRSEKVRRTSHGPDVFAGGVGPTIVYGPIQERGGWTGRGHRSYLPPRPFQRPAAFNSIPKIRRLFADVWTRAIKG